MSTMMIVFLIGGVVALLEKVMSNNRDRKNNQEIINGILKGLLKNQDK